MSPADYVATQAALVEAGRALVKLNLPAFLSDISLCETVGPILDPTLWIRGGTKLERVKRLALAAMALRGEVLVQLREEFGGAFELAGLDDEDLAALVPAKPADEAGSGGEDTHHAAPSVHDLGIPPARSESAADPAPPADRPESQTARPWMDQ